MDAVKFDRSKEVSLNIIPKAKVVRNKQFESLAADKRARKNAKRLAIKEKGGYA